MRLISGIHYSKEQIMAWMKRFCNGDPMEETFRRRIIDVFINSVYVYDNKIVIYYNIKEGKQVSYMEMCDDLENLDDNADTGGAKEKSGVRISDGLPRQTKV